MEATLVTLVDDLHQRLNRERVSLMDLLDLSAAFDTIGYGVLLGQLAELQLGGNTASQ